MAKMAPKCGQVGPSRGKLGQGMPRWAKLRPCWGQVGAKLGPRWSHVGPSWHQVEGKLGPGWGKLGQVGPSCTKLGQ
eukprot:11428625-Karenia_brevis.AAC.1